MFAPEVSVILQHHPDAHILMPSVAAGFRYAVEDWVKALLDYQIQGTYVQIDKNIVAGKKVSELITAINHHYTVTGGSVLREGVDHWENALNTYLSLMKQNKNIKSLWATEELGSRGFPLTGPYQKLKGQGSAVVARLIAQYLYFANKNDLSPEQLRVLFWGWNLSSSNTGGGFAFSELKSILGESSLINLDLAGNTSPSTMEVHAFRDPMTQKVFVFIFPQHQGDTLTLNQVAIPLTAPDLVRYKPQANIFLFARQGFSQSTIPVDMGLKNDFLFKFPQPISLGTEKTGTFTLDKQDVLLIELDPLL